MLFNGHLDLNIEGKAINIQVYRSMIGFLLYLLALPMGPTNPCIEKGRMMV